MNTVGFAQTATLDITEETLSIFQSLCFKTNRMPTFRILGTIPLLKGTIADSSTGPEKIQMSLEHLAVLQSKEMIKKMMRTCHMDIRVTPDQTCDNLYFEMDNYHNLL